MNIVLRKYQWEMRDKIHESWKKVRRVLSVLPPGAGKTAIISTVANQLTKNAEIIWVINNRSTVIQQLYQKIKTITGQNITPLRKEIKASEPGIYIGTIQYVKRHYKDWTTPSTIIIDEAHHCGAESYQELINYHNKSKVLGLTATPCRSDGKHLLGNTFDEMLTGISMREMIDKNFLCNYEIIQAPRVNSQQMQTQTDNKQLPNQETLEDLEKLVQSYKIHCNNQPCLVFAPTASSCKIIANAYQRSGISADFVESEQSENMTVLENFKQGKFSVLVNCEMLIDGIDIPMLKAIQIARRTESLTIWIQMCGRVLRTWPGKNIALIIDHTENHIIHGKPCSDYNWELLAKPKADDIQKREINLTQTSDNAIKKLESLLVGLDDEEFTDSYQIVKTSTQNQPSFNTKLDIDIETWQHHNNIETELIYKIYQEEGIKKTIQTIKERRIPVNWKVIFSFLIQVKETKEYHKKWLVYTCFEIKAPLDVWQQIAIYLNYQIGWAYHCHREMQESKTKTNIATNKTQIPQRITGSKPINTHKTRKKP